MDIKKYSSSGDLYSPNKMTVSDIVSSDNFKNVFFYSSVIHESS